MIINSALKAVEKLAEVGGNLTDADQQAIKSVLYDRKKLKIACNFAENIFFGKKDTKFFGDNSFIGTDSIIKESILSEEQKDSYIELRMKFNKYD